MRKLVRIILILILPNLFSVAAGAARPCAALLANVVSHLAVTTNAGRGLVLTFRDRGGRVVSRHYQLERVRVVDGQIKLRLSAGAEVVTLIARPYEADAKSATLKVRSMSGPPLGLGEDLRVTFEVP